MEADFSSREIASPLPVVTEAGTPDRKRIVERWVEEVVNQDRFAVADELCTPHAARRTRAWVFPFREAFPDVRMEPVELVSECETVVGHFRCSGTHRGTWLTHPPSGRRFEGIDEVYFFYFEENRIAGFWGLEDSRRRLRQLGLA